MSGAGFLWLEKITGSGIIRKAAKHNKREIQAEMGAAGSIDPTRSHLNYALVGPDTADEVAHLAKGLMRAAGVVKNRKNGVLGIEVLFSLPHGHPVDDRVYFTACVDWAARYFGGAGNILSADVHHDEAQLHCHLLILPLLEGKMNASKMVGNTQKLEAMQDQFHAEVAQLYGLRKPGARLSVTAKKAAAQAVLQHLRETGDSALQSAGWANIRAGIENDPGPWLLTFDIEIEAPAKKVKLFVDYVTSKGKGPARERSERIAIENLPPAQPNPLPLCRELSKPPLSAASPPPARPAQLRPPPAARQVPDRQPVIDLPEIQEQKKKEAHDLDRETVRARDDDHDPALYDFDTGSWRPQPAAEPARRRQAADACVAATLPAKRTGAPRHGHGPS
jgi:hypothetical protein